MKIKTNNPYFDKVYETSQFTKEHWLAFLANYRRGNEDFFMFVDKNSGEIVTVNPKNFASIEVED
ncbi:hypothetical protein [Enterococcus sp. AZ103]|uniref:hypothetical protein n=1 Tax=Enterococcus sp. AZ103 TaxID=2774628 RepID=UPI003F212517